MAGTRIANSSSPHHHSILPTRSSANIDVMKLFPGMSFCISAHSKMLARHSSSTHPSSKCLNKSRDRGIYLDLYLFVKRRPLLQHQRNEYIYIWLSYKLCRLASALSSSSKRMPLEILVRFRKFSWFATSAEDEQTAVILQLWHNGYANNHMRRYLFSWS